MLKKRINNMLISIRFWLYRRALKNHSLSIISNNCWGGFMSQRMQVQYNSPFVGLFLFADDYIKLLQRIDLIYKPIIFISKKESKYEKLPEKKYVIGCLPGGIEIHFLHYHTQEEALSKWNKRLKRLDMNNLLVKFSERDGCTEHLIKEFDALPFANKVCFTVRNYSQYKCTCLLKDQAGQIQAEGYWKSSNKYWDIFLNANIIGGYKNTLWIKLLCSTANMLPINE